MVKRGDMMDINDMIDILAIDLMGVVPEDETIVVSTNKGEPAVLDMNSGRDKAYRNIAKRLMGEDVPLISLEVEDGLFGKLKKLLGFKG
jgi:septum site-determining protein MinD